MSRPVHIHYHRPPARTETYVQTLLYDGADVKISFHPSAPIAGPLTLDGRTLLAPGSPVVWFTFPGRWHDIGRFHTAEGAFTGLYANVLTPVRLPEASEGTEAIEWHTTDLFLDVWMGVDGALRILDQDEWAQALAQGHIEPELARRAQEEVDAIVDLATRGLWPPPVVHEWPLERALAAAPARPVSE